MDSHGTLIAIAAVRLDNLLRLSSIPDAGPYSPDATLQGGVTNRHALPDLVAQLLLGNHPVPVGE